MTPVRASMLRRRNESGISAIIVGVCGTLLMGLAAFVLDTGALYTERRELQVGADAAALSLAIDCARADCTDLNSRADSFADQNAADDQADATAQILTGDRVEVVTRTNDAGSNIDGDSSTVDFYFGRIWGRNGAPVAARAVAGWASPSGGTTIPLTFSLCEWNKTGGITGLTPGPPYSGPIDLIFFHDPQGNPDYSDCNAPAGQDYDGDTRLNGGFGWLNPTTGCSVTINAAGWVAGSTGTSGPNTCTPSTLLNTEIMIPIFDDLYKGPANGGPCGSTRCYHVYGWAGFYITGMRLGGNGNEWTVNPPASCTPASRRCIGGYFISFVLGATAGSGGGGPDLGAKVIRLLE
jgi:Flp pilus assembly protein TadG